MRRVLSNRSRNLDLLQLPRDQLVGENHMSVVRPRALEKAPKADPTNPGAKANRGRAQKTSPELVTQEMVSDIVEESIALSWLDICLRGIHDQGSE